MKKFLLFFALVLVSFQGYAQVIYGVNNYTQYHIGSLPIVISVPHGGLVAPVIIPDRTCNSPTTVWDNYTIELGRQIDTALYNLTGCHPHLIICNMRRTKVDCNRNIADGACGNSQAETVWTEFQHFIDTAEILAQSQFAGKAFYIDLHAHGHAIKQLELGYGISGAGLTNTDNVLNTAPYIASSSIENSVATNVNGYTHAQLLRGTYGLGTLFVNAGFPSVPSMQTPNPGGNPYFSGGYNTYNHTCILQGNTVNGVQIETPSTVWSSYSNRKKFADSTAAVLANYLMIHQNINLITNCGIPFTPLPISLIDFWGKAAEEKNILWWTTANEINNDYFTLMKSSDGINFESIAKIKGAGNSTHILNYSFDDRHLTSAIHYYKLQQTDYNGQSTFSKVIRINNFTDEIFVSPNPVKDFIQLSFSPLENNFEVELLNTFGETMLKTNNQIRLNGSHFPAGIYLLKITDCHNHVQNKIIVKQ
ncbi:MAG: T9SS type A sorting domain-containing protein [Bacteroidetes bacterium]|nr:T9SS type A sorting domain-containing protein [Bacteroidota bacterium]